jgi:hypothetical protein
MGKRVLLALTIIMLSAATACSSASSIDDRASDSGHAFLIQSAQVFDGISEDIAPEDEAYLIIKCQIENLQSQDDSFRRWADQITLEFAEESYAMTFINSLDDQLWETSLAKGEKKAGYIAFLVPEDTFQFDLTLTLPTSGTEVVYAIAALDKRISESVDWVLTRLGTIENNKKIPLIGEPLAMAQNIKYHGIILVPKEDISQLMEQTDGLPENDKRAVIEDYLLEHGHCRLE